MRIVIVLPADTTLLDVDMGGSPVGSQLLEALARHPSVTVERIGGPGAPPQRGLADLATDTGLILIDGRYWRSAERVEAMMACALAATTCVRVISSSGVPTAVLPESLIIPAQRSSADLGRRLEACRGAGFQALVDAAVAMDPAAVPLSVDLGGGPAILIGSFADLAHAEQLLMLARASDAMQAGVRVRNPRSLYIRGTLRCGTGVEIDANVIIEGVVMLGDRVHIGANSIIRDATVGTNARINPYSLVERSLVGADGFIGPYARIRPGSEIGDRVQIGNYVEIKGSRIGSGCRINHHSFIGDASLGDDVTIGAGTITCNHDGRGPARTVIERGAYIGSGCMLVAPLRIGADATIGAGSTITEDAPAGKLTLARARHKTVEDWRR